MPRLSLSRPLQRAAAVLAAWLAVPALALAQIDPPGRVGRIADVDGPAWVYDDEEGDWTPAERNRPVTQGDRFSTERDARVELRVGSTTVRLGGGSEVAFDRLDDDALGLRLLRGSMALRLLSPEVAERTSVVTDEGRFDPQRSGHYRFDRRDGVTFAGAWRGELQFRGRENLRLVGTGERIEVWLDGPYGYARTREADLPGDRLSAWALEADRRAWQTASAPYVSPEMTGVEDLDRHGHWERHPEHGGVWVPHDVPPGWAPYRDGRWAWMRPWGWTWVDAAPWGFAPFHYGRWVSWGGRWCWSPGAYVARPVFAPALVAWIGGPHVGVSVSIGGGVGWVPLAPREVYVPSYAVSPVYIDRVNRGHHPGRGYRPGRPVQVPTGPIMYGNQGVPGGVTVVASDVLRDRRPVGSAPRTPVPSEWSGRPFVPGAAPPPPSGRKHTLPVRSFAPRERGDDDRRSPGRSADDQRGRDRGDGDRRGRDRDRADDGDRRGGRDAEGRAPGDGRRSGERRPEPVMREPGRAEPAPQRREAQAPPERRVPESRDDQRRRDQVR